MKTIKVIIAGVFLFIGFGCQYGFPPTARPESVSVFGFDLTSYSKKGFLITPEKWNGNYESIGIFTLDCYPLFTNHIPETQDKVSNYVPDEILNKYDIVKDVRDEYWYVRKINPDSVITKFYDYASKLGADAITNFSIVQKFYVNSTIQVPYYEITGFAIKRK